MSTDGKREPPPYILPVAGGTGGGGGDGVKVYHVHTPFTPGSSTIEPYGQSDSNEGHYTSAVQAQNVSSSHAAAPTDDGVKRFVSEDRQLGHSPGMTTCPTCQQQVLTEVTYKIGAYAWIMCIVFILCGLVLCCCLIPLLHKHFKDAYHTCPRCQRVLYVDKKKCCS
ncbi:lipopolysaccharide-induced tumor necrosis factor-alpha factor homolog-like [Sardina pilchardus]|uniref:lipopolysaccharide-induced tumor necrosis factor-alpha factor homolog-like n=1 Tax=Sardina pilchardus TaxID=27697 RepID=UPI002E0FC2A5